MTLPHPVGEKPTAVQGLSEVDLTIKYQDCARSNTKAYPQASIQKMWRVPALSSKILLDPCSWCYPEELVEILRERDLLPDYMIPLVRLIEENTVDYLG